MRSVWIAMLVVAGCKRPLAPGETRCTSNNVYGTTFTNCETGQQPPPPAPVYVAPQRPAEIWCTQAVEYGVCYPSAGECEAARTRLGIREWGACFQTVQTFCNRQMCFTSPAGCADYERQSKRDGSACVKYPR